MSNEVIVLTSNIAAYPDLKGENLAMIDSLKKAGLNSKLVCWHELFDQLMVNKKPRGLLLMRTVWDYPLYFEKFMKFIDLIHSSHLPCINPVEVIKWNVSKMYLLDIKSVDISIVPAQVILKGEQTPVVEYFSVLKPVIGLGASGAIKLSPGQSVTAHVDSIFNPFRQTVYEGELSIIMVSGEAVLTVKKTPSPSDWRVQPQYGGEYTVQSDADPAALNLCRKLYSCIKDKFRSELFLYMRVDLLKNDSGGWEVLEFEAIDPSLYGSISSQAVDALSSAIKSL